MSTNATDRAALTLVTAIFAIAVLKPSLVAAAEPGKLALGLYVPVQSTQFTSDDRPVEASPGTTFGFGASVGWDFNAHLAAQFDIKYLGWTSGEINETPTTEFSYGAAGGSAVLFVRPLGRTELAPSVGIGASRSVLTNRRVEVFDGDDISNQGDEALRDGRWQGVGAVALGWHPGWDEGSIRVYAEGRINGPPTAIGSSSSELMRDVQAWSVEVRLGITLFVFG